MNKKLHKISILTFFTIILAQYIACIETEINIPSFPDMLLYFKVSEAIIQWIISGNFIGICFGAIIFGPLSDVIGRKKVLCIGAVIFLIGSYFCISSDNIKELIFFRFLQGIGASSLFSIFGATPFDLYDEEKAARIIGILNGIITFFIGLSPIIGAYINHLYGWRAIFIFVAILAGILLFCSIFLLDETLEKNKFIKFEFKKIIINYVNILCNLKGLGYLTIYSLLCSAGIVYIANLSLLFVNEIGINKITASYYQSLIPFTYAITSLLSSKLILWFGTEKVKIYSLILQLIGCVLMILTGIYFQNEIIVITLSNIIVTIGFAIGIASFYANYMNYHPNFKGQASSFCIAYRLSLMGLIVAISGYYYNKTILPVAYSIFLCVFISLMIYLLIIFNQNTLREN